MSLAIVSALGRVMKRDTGLFLKFPSSRKLPGHYFWPIPFFLEKSKLLIYFKTEEKPHQFRAKKWK
jgi:hypothetical protein